MKNLLTLTFIILTYIACANEKKTKVSDKSTDKTKENCCLQEEVYTNVYIYYFMLEKDTIFTQVKIGDPDDYLLKNDTTYSNIIPDKYTKLYNNTIIYYTPRDLFLLEKKQDKYIKLDSIPPFEFEFTGEAFNFFPLNKYKILKNGDILVIMTNDGWGFVCVYRIINNKFVQVFKSKETFDFDNSYDGDFDFEKGFIEIKDDYVQIIHVDSSSHNSEYYIYKKSKLYYKDGKYFIEE